MKTILLTIAIACSFSPLAFSENAKSETSYCIQYKVAHVDNYKRPVTIEPSLTISVGQTVTMSITDRKTTYLFDVKLELVNGHPTATSKLKIEHDDSSVVGMSITQVCNDPEQEKAELKFGDSQSELQVRASAAKVDLD